MTFLPIVDRELRAAARRKSTYRIRWWTAVIAMVLTFFAFLVASLPAVSPGIGKPLFNFLTTYALCLCLLAGVLLTSDCLSEEKREGTLGLLFLTDLKGYDVVLGKLMAISLNALYALLALVPVTALPLLLGGVTGAEFWRTALALVNALFFALATGICTSTFMRDSQQAIRGALGLLVLLAILLPLLAWTAARAGLSSPVWSFWAWISPLYSFSYAGDLSYLGHPGRFWAALVVSQLTGWLFVALASSALPQQWKEKGSTSGPELGLNRLPRRRRAAQVKRLSDRVKWLAINPALWLIARGQRPIALAWWIVVLWAATLLAFGVRSLFIPAKLSEILLKLVLAFQACHFFVEARRTGALELLLCTPLRSRDIVKGHWLAFRRTFFWPVLLAVLLNFIPFGVQVASVLDRPGAGQLWLAIASSVGMLVSIAWFVVALVADMVAIAWLGMWLALSVKNPAHAPVITVLVGLLTAFRLCGVNLFLDLGLILWSVTKLQQDFRWVLVRQYQPVMPYLAPQPASPPPGAPPIIGH